MQSYIYITFEIPSVHRWSEAPKDVRFLRATHRHVFHYRVMAEVTHNDRQLEFFQLQSKCNQFLIDTHDHDEFVFFFGELSCEQLAAEMLNHIPEAFQVEVSEDGENGATVRRT